MSRIAMIAHSCFPGNPRVRTQAFALAALGHEVEVVCLRGPGESPREVCGGVGVTRIGVSRDRSSGKLGYALEYARSLAGCAAALVRLESRAPMDLVVVHNVPEELVFATIPVKLRGVPVLLDIHDPLPELFADKYGIAPGSRTKRLLDRLELACCRFADHVLVAADPFKTRLVRNGLPAEKMTVILNSPRSARPPGDEREPFVVVYHGSVFDRYGLETVLRGLALAAERIPGLQLHVFGSDVDEACLGRLKGLAGRLGVSSRVAFSGYVAPLALESVLSSADVGLCPLRRSSHIDLTYPTKLLQFLDHGVPVLCAATPALEEAFRSDGVRFYKDDDPDAFAEALVALSSAERRARPARQGALRYEHSWPEMERRYVHVVGTLTRRSRRRRARSHPRRVSGEQRA